MADRPASRSLLFSLALPIVAVGLMIGRGELTTRTGRPYLLSIRGYDPRDLVSGHYLTYRVDFRWEEPGERCTSASCAYCLSGPAGTEPRVTKVSSGDTAGCDAWFADTQLEHLQQFFIPEDMGPPLERAIRQRKAQLLVRVSRGGSVVVQDLLLDGRPWREVAR